MQCMKTIGLAVKNSKINWKMDLNSQSYVVYYRNSGHFSRNDLSQELNMRRKHKQRKRSWNRNGLMIMRAIVVEKWMKRWWELLNNLKPLRRNLRLRIFLKHLFRIWGLCVISWVIAFGLLNIGLGKKKTRQLNQHQEKTS